MASKRSRDEELEDAQHELAEVQLRAHALGLLDPERMPKNCKLQHLLHEVMRCAGFDKFDKHGDGLLTYEDLTRGSVVDAAAAAASRPTGHSLK